MAQSLEYENIWQEVENFDLIDFVTPNEVFNAIQVYDSTIEVIGFVDSIEPPRIVGDGEHLLFKFYLNNENGHRIPVLAWNDNIVPNLHHIILNSVVHLDGVQATIPESQAYNNGTVPYQLIIRENTIVTNLSNYKSTPFALYTALNRVRGTSGPIIVEAYIKSNFMEREYPNDKSNTFGCGSVTDGIYKLEIHIKDFSRADYLTLGIEKGNKIKVMGIISTDSPTYLQVKDIRSIRKLEGHMSFNKMLEGHLCIS